MSEPSQHADQRWLLAGAGLAFLTDIVLSVFSKGSETIVGIAIGAGASAIGAMGGVSRSSSIGNKITTVSDPPDKTTTIVDPK